MMSEIALHVLDIAENSVRAGAKFIEILVKIDQKKDALTIEVKDDGCGMSEQQVKEVQNPFYTTRATRKVGLGIPFLQEAAVLTGGEFWLHSQVGKGTVTGARFVLSSIDRMPLGTINQTIYTLAVFHPEVDFRYQYEWNDRVFELDTREIKEILAGLPIQSKEVADFILDYLEENKRETDGGTEV